MLKLITFHIFMVFNVQGTRLGSSDPKGCFSKYPLFLLQWFINKRLLLIFSIAENIMKSLFSDNFPSVASMEVKPAEKLPILVFTLELEFLPIFYFFTLVGLSLTMIASSSSAPKNPCTFFSFRKCANFTCDFPCHIMTFTTIGIPTNQMTLHFSN